MAEKRNKAGAFGKGDYLAMLDEFENEVVNEIRPRLEEIERKLGIRK